MELAELAKEKGVVNYVGYNNVMNPANAYVKELVESGKLGKIVKFSGTYDQDGLLDESLPINLGNGHMDFCIRDISEPYLRTSCIYRNCITLDCQLNDFFHISANQ